MKKRKHWIWICLIILIAAGFGIGYVMTQMKESGREQTTNQAPTHQNSSNQSESKKDAASSTNMESIQPNEMESNIDAVNYQTVEVTKSNDSAEIHILIEGNKDDVSKFVVPYTNIIKDLNKDISDVVLKIYSSQENLNNHKPSWEYKNVTITVLQEK